MVGYSIKKDSPFEMCFRENIPNPFPGDALISMFMVVLLG